MPADSKKVQTVINKMADVVERMRDAQVIRDAFIAANPSITGTPLQGKGPAVRAWLDELLAVANSPIAQGFIDNKVPSHRGVSL